MDNKWHIGLTEDAIRERVVAEAVKYIGVREGTKEHKMIVDTYNSQGKLPRGYKLQYTDAWCAGFISFLGIVLGITNIILPECSCSKMIELYKALGLWVEDDAHVPELGDIIMYAWDAKSGENLLPPDHTGVMVKKEDKTLFILEGNYDNQVKLRKIPIEYVKTRGFCKPDYASLVQNYTDVPDDIWYAKEITKATELGIVNGVGNGKFDPERPVTRAECAAIAVRLYELLSK